MFTYRKSAKAFKRLSTASFVHIDQNFINKVRPFVMETNTSIIRFKQDKSRQHKCGQESANLRGSYVKLTPQELLLSNITF